VTGCTDPAPEIDKPRANAAFVVLARNKELEGVIQSIKSIERHFNRWFHYPYVFLNDGDFNQTFKEVVTNYTSAPVEWGKIDASMWGFPDWVDKSVAKEGIAKQGDAAIMYGGMESYHHMCRFYSGYVDLCFSRMLLTFGKPLLQTRASAEVQVVLAIGARDQVLLRHHIVCFVSTRALF
jgi:mannosyltransferase